jgi:hypothetical protein
VVKKKGDAQAHLSSEEKGDMHEQGVSHILTRHISLLPNSKKKSIIEYSPRDGS